MGAVREFGNNALYLIRVSVGCVGGGEGLGVLARQAKRGLQLSMFNLRLRCAVEVKGLASVHVWLKRGLKLSMFNLRLVS